MNILYLKGYKWLLSQNRRALAKCIKPFLKKALKWKDVSALASTIPSFPQNLLHLQYAVWNFVMIMLEIDFTKQDYIMRQKTVITNLLQSATNVLYKVFHSVQSQSGVTEVYKKWVRYCNVYQAVITKCAKYYKFDIKPVKLVITGALYNNTVCHTESVKLQSEM